MIDPLVVPVDGKTLDWPRRVANAFAAIRRIVAGMISDAITEAKPHPFEELSGAPASPDEGRTYYDTTLHKARTWDGSAWQDHW